MNEIAKRIVYLVNKFLREELNETERIELETWIAQSEGNRRFFDKLTNSEYLFKAVSDSDSEERSLQKILKLIEAEEGPEGKVVMSRRFTWRRMTVAAAVMLMVIAGVIYFMLPNKKAEVVAEVQAINTVHDIAPGGDGAILKLSNGQEIVLTNNGNGIVAQQGTASVNKQGNLLTYNNTSNNSQILYNTLSTPVGRQFQLILPDGTRAWLNSASSITYTTSFTGNERNVIVSGEVYMEVAKDPAKPFKAHVISPVSGMGETTIEVLGTHFNINGYGDETPVKTTLLEGKVKVTKGNSLALLKPGQQAQVGSDKINIKTGVDTDKETAWKDGLFFFKKEKLKTIMPQIARWYDIDVVYKDDVQDKLISGKIDRSVNLSEMLKIFGLLKIDCRIEGRKLILKRNPI